MGEYCQKQDKMLPVYIIKMAGGNCSDGDDLVEAVVNKPKIEVFTKHGFFQAV